MTDFSKFLTVAVHVADRGLYNTNYVYICTGIIRNLYMFSLKNI